MIEQSRTAILINAEDIPHQSVPIIYSAFRPFCDIRIFRVFGNFSKPSLSQWLRASRELPLKLEMTPENTHGKSSADLALSKVLLSKLSDDDFRRYDAIRRRLIRISQKENTEKETLARAFLSEISGIPDADVPDSRVTALSVHIGMAAGLFTKLANISKKDPGSYSRAQQKAAK